jgi:hypothetical protein
MELNMTVALIEGQLAQIKEMRDLEIEARDALSNNITAIMNDLFEGAPDKFLQSNGHFANELARGAGELADAISGAAINWTGGAKDAGMSRFFSKQLVRLLAVDGLVSGKIGIYPRIDETGQLSAEVMSGYLHVIFSPTNALKIEEVLQVVQDPATQKYTVTRYSPGLVERFEPVDDWVKFATARSTPFAQKHAPKRLPIAFAVVRRDAHGEPYGLASEAMPAFRRYAKTAVNRNAVQEIAGFPERVLKSDKYLQLLLGEVRRPNVAYGQEDPAITAFKSTGPRKLKVIGTNDVYEITNGVDPAPHVAAEVTDKASLLDVLRSPDLGGNVAAQALIERQSKHRAFVKDMCDMIADVVTDAAALASALPGSEIPKDIIASLKPTFADDTSGAVARVNELFKSGALYRWQVMLELQSLGYTSITDEAIEREKKLQEADGEPIIPDEVQV